MALRYEIFQLRAARVAPPSPLNWCPFEKGIRFRSIVANPATIGLNFYRRHGYCCLTTAEQATEWDPCTHLPARYLNLNWIWRIKLATSSCAREPTCGVVFWGSIQSACSKRPARAFPTTLFDNTTTFLEVPHRPTITWTPYKFATFLFQM